MPAYNFQKQFAPAVKSGDKHQTIRAKRKHRPRVGQTAYCFTGMRTKKCRRLCKKPILRVRDISICRKGYTIDGFILSTKSTLDRYAREDGFLTWAEMLGWFKRTHGLPFRGDLIMW